MAEKCNHCTAFNVHAPHLNNRLECTCLDDIPPPVDGPCTSATPCSICRPLIAKGKADCNNCREHNSDAKLAMHCFNCVRRVFLFSQDFHRATITASRVVRTPGTGMPPTSEDYTAAAGPFFTDRPSIVEGKADHNKCLKRNCDHSHTKQCFNCLSQHLHDESNRHRDATLAAARISHLPSVSDDDPEHPSSGASPSDDGDKLTIALAKVGEEHLRCPAAPTPSDTACDSETDDGEAEGSRDKSSAASSSPTVAGDDLERLADGVQRNEEALSPPALPASNSTRSSKRKRRFSQVVPSPTPEPRSSASPGPSTTNKRIPRTLLRRPINLPTASTSASAHQPPRSPSPIPNRPSFIPPDEEYYLLHTDITDPNNNNIRLGDLHLPSYTPSLIPNPNAIPYTVPSAEAISSVRRQRSHAAFMDKLARETFGIEWEHLLWKRERLWGKVREVEAEQVELRASLMDVETQDGLLRMKECERLRGEIRRLEEGQL